jgi:hypothetical protein
LIVSVSAQDWEDPTEFFGCGRFAADSWRIFCRGGAARLTARDVDDPTLQRYLRWARTGSAEPRAPRPRKRRAAAAATAAPAKRAAGAAALAASGSGMDKVQGEQCPQVHGARERTRPRHSLLQMHFTACNVLEASAQIEVWGRRPDAPGQAGARATQRKALLSDVRAASHGMQT